MTDIRTYPVFDGDGGSSPVQVAAPVFFDVKCAGDVEEDLRAELKMLRSDLAELVDRVARLELDRIAETAED